MGNGLFVSKGKNPRSVASGKVGAARRWGPWPHRTVHLDRLDPLTREIVVAIMQGRRHAIEAAQQAAVTESEAVTAESAEGTTDATPTT